MGLAWNIVNYHLRPFVCYYRVYTRVTSRFPFLRHLIESCCLKILVIWFYRHCGVTYSVKLFLRSLWLVWYKEQKSVQYSILRDEETKFYIKLYDCVIIYYFHGSMIIEMFHWFYLSSVFLCDLWQKSEKILLVSSTVLLEKSLIITYIIFYDEKYYLPWISF